LVSLDNKGKLGNLVRKGLVSIIVPTFNRPQSLRKTLKSIFQQSYRNFEVIVVDDGSERDISKALRAYPVVKIVRQRHSGSNVARNRGFAQSKGEFLLFCDDDTELDPSFLEKMVEALRANPQKAYAYCGFELDGKVLGMEPFDPEKLRKRNYIDTGSLIVRSKFVGFDPKMKRFQDWDLWLTMLDRGWHGVLIPEVLYKKTLKKWPRITDESNQDAWTASHAYKFVADKHNLPTLRARARANAFRNALETLVSIYDSREDLQGAYPEVKGGDCRRLIAWAHGVVTGKFSDSAHPELQLHKDAYAAMHQKIRRSVRPIDDKKPVSPADLPLLLKQVFERMNTENKTTNSVNRLKPLLILLAVYLSRQDLQDAFPEIHQGDLENLVNWAADHGTSTDSAKNLLSPYRDWFVGQKEVMSTSKKSIPKLLEALTTMSKDLSARVNEIGLLRDESSRHLSDVAMKEQLIRELGGKVSSLEQESSRHLSDVAMKEQLIRELGGKVSSLEQESSRHLSDLASCLSLTLRLTKSTDVQSSTREGVARHLRKILARSIDVISNEGLVSFSKQTIEKIRKREFRIVELGSPPTTGSSRYYVSQPDLSKSEVSYAKNRVAEFRYKPKISIIVPVYNTDRRWLTETLESVRRQFYENWELCICDNGSTLPHVSVILDDIAQKDARVRITRNDNNLGIAAGSQSALSLASGEFIALLDHDDMLYPDALLEVVHVLNDDPKLDYIFSDEDKIDENRRRTEPFFRPDWSPELMLCGCYTTHLSVFRKSLVDELGGFRTDCEGSQDWDLILRVTEKTSKIGHVRKILYGWRKAQGSTALSQDLKAYAHDSAKRALADVMRRRNIPAVIEDGLFFGTFRVKRQILGTPLVSIIIPSAKIGLLKKCVRSLLDNTDYRNLEIVIVNGTRSSDIDADLPRFPRYKIINDPHPERYNFSAINNAGARAATGEYLLFLNDDTRFFQPQWLEAMLEHAQNPEVGAVGAKLLYPDGRVQHAGVVIGLSNGLAGHYEGIGKQDHGYFGLADVIRNCSAVTAACMMTKREDFLRMGGFDEELARSWQDVDYCLKLLETGLRVVYTPYSQLYHTCGGTRGRVDKSPDEEESRRLFRQKWRSFIKKGDPYYNPNLSLDVLYAPKLADPMEMLMYVYSSRPDLKKAYPEAMNGDLRTLLKWAADWGITIDSYKSLLEPFADWYRAKFREVAR
jgi:glycosyltransferase involved in cell wall biosynthesis